MYIRPMLFKKGNVHVAVYALNADKELTIIQKCEEGTLQFEEAPDIIQSFGDTFIYRYPDKRAKRDIQRQQEEQNFGYENPNTGFEEDRQESALRWIKILLVHQNKYRGVANTTFYPEILPMDFDLVLWGNEHESIPNLTVPYGKKATRILFPGSSVIVTTKKQEQNPKHKCNLFSRNIIDYFSKSNRQ